MKKIALTIATLLLQLAFETSTQAEIQTENTATSNTIKSYLADNFGIPELKASWYDNITGVTVIGDTVSVKTNLTSYTEKSSHICAGVSFFVFSNKNNSLGLHTIKVYSQSGGLLINRSGISEKC